MSKNNLISVEEAEKLLKFDDLTINQTDSIHAFIDCGNLSKAAEEMGVSLSSFRRTIERAKTKAEKTCFTEQIATYFEWSKDECMESLMTIVEAHPQRVITRNFYRNETGVADSTWVKHFGTFMEFKRQASVTPSRHVHQMEKNIAKHASQDILASLTKEKRSYEGKYEKSSSGRWKTIIKVSDTHGHHLCPFYRRVVLDTIKRVQPDIIVHQGDAYDMAEFGQYTVDPREWDIVKDLEAGQGFFRDMRAAAPNAQIDYLESNHDWRLLRHLADATPQMRAVLSDLHGFTFTKLLKIDEYEINYIGRSNLKAFSKRDIKTELAKNWKIYYGCSFAAHGHEKEIPHMHGTIGHTHKYKVNYGYDHARGAYGVYYLGYGSTNGDEYTNAAKYQKGFMIETIDTLTKTVSPQYIDLTNGFCQIGGKYYEDEVLLQRTA